MKFNGSVKILSKKWLLTDVFQITVERKKEMGEIISGQFFNIKSSTNGYPMLNRPISVSDFGEEWIEFTVKVLGVGTQSMSSFELGESLNMIGPLGNGFEKLEAKKVLIVGGGIGVAPLKKISKEEKNLGAEVHVILGFRDEPYMVDDFKVNASDIQVVSEVTEGYRKGYVTEPLLELLEKNDYDMVYSCGPQKMLENVAKILVKNNVTGQILMEEKMACGIGACLVCTCKIKDEEKGYKHKRMCKDGPMFYADEVIFDE